VKTYFWEFFGPNALPTARHFERHLLQFLAEHDFAAEETGVIEAPGQALVFASASAGAGEAIEGALKPAQVAEGALPVELRDVFEATTREVPPG